MPCKRRKEERDIRASRLQLVIRLLIVLAFVLVLISGSLLWRQGLEYKEGNSSYQELREVARPGINHPDPGQMNPASPVDFEALRKINDGIAGWLSSEGTVIDYPVVQGWDNDYYLNHLFSGESNKLGTLFLDYRNDNLFEDPLSVIYGHNMRDKSMLTSIAGYIDQTYYDAHPVMMLHTPGAAYRVRLFAGITVSGSSHELRLSFSGDDDFLAYIRSLKERSTFTSFDDLDSTDRILALVTCTYSFQNARYILFGKLEKMD